MFNPSVFRRLTIILLIALGLFIILTFEQYGISNDEEVQHIYGRLLLDFYTSGFTDQDAFHYRNLYLYGGFFDLVAAVLEKFVPIWIWDLRHLLSAAFGLSGIIASYKAARLLGNERSGFIVAVLLAITGAWTGAMFTHTKDVPFATCMIWALYYSMRLSRQLPKPSLWLCIKLGIAVGCALGLRIGGVFSVFYLLLAVLIGGWIAGPGFRQKWQYWLTSAWRLLPAGITAFALMALFWPWGVMSPDHPLQAAEAFSHFAFNMLTVMDGEVMKIGEVPREYLPSYLLVRLPEVFLLGLLAMLIIGLFHLREWRPQSRQFLPWLLVSVAAMFPLAFILLDKPALYNGVRHFTFLIPPLAVLSGMGLSMSWDALAKVPKLRWLGTGVVAVLTVATTVTMVQLHPYEYIYYNRLAGSLPYAESHWEGDYWSSSLREAAEILEDKLPELQAVDKQAGDGLNHAPYKVAVCAESIQGDAYLDHRFQITSDWVSADFFISSTNMNCDKVLQGKIIGTVERMGAILAVVKDRRNLHPKYRFPRPAPH